VRYRFVPALVLTVLALPAPAFAGTVGHVRYATDSQASFPSYEQSARRQGFVILHAWQQDRMQALKAANPELKVLVYKNLSFSNYMTNSGFSASGVPGAEADREHPEWFLRNTSGERFTSWSYGWSWAMDVGSPSYQQRWADNVIAELRSRGWDGVFMDDTNPTMKYHYTPSAVAKYPSDAAYGAATRSALATIGPRVKAAGKLALANIGSWAGYPATARDWLQFLDGGMDEMFLKWGNRTGEGYADLARWQTQLGELKAADRSGKFFLAIMHSDPTDAAAARYGYATMLLGSDGRGHFALAHDYTNETWFPEYDYDLGRPTGPESAGADGVHRRSFERGLVLVNPTAQSRAASFGGTYSGSRLSGATHATLAPTSGLVLMRDRAAADVPLPAVTEPISVLATVKAPRRVALRWRGGARGMRYRIKRNGHTIAVVGGRRFQDRHVRPGRPQRYRIAVLTRDGRVVGRSRPLRIRTRRGRRTGRAVSAATRSRVDARLASRATRASRAYVELQARRGGRVRWRRLTKPVRPRAAMRFRLRLGRPAAVRVVVEFESGPALRSGVVRAGA
jgi:hypothetical protein